MANTAHQRTGTGMCPAAVMPPTMVAAASTVTGMRMEPAEGLQLCCDGVVLPVRC